LKKAPMMMGLVWDYLVEANIDPERLKFPDDVALFFSSLCRHLLYGTNSSTPANPDVTALKWLPRSPQVVKGLAYAFDEFARVMSRKKFCEDQFVKRCPGIFTGSFRLAYRSSGAPDVSRVAHAREGEHSRHIQDVDIKPVLEGLIPQNTKAAARSLSPTKRTPKDLLFPILTKAFIVRTRKDGSVKRDRSGEFSAALLLGALRGAEIFHLWVSDLQLTNQGKLYGFLRHPALYLEPGDGSRRDLLRRRYSGLVPRNEAQRTAQYAGFKSVALNADYWASIVWLPNTEDFVRITFVRYILEVRGPAMEERRKLGLPPHPFLLVFPHSIPHLGVKVGDPYTLGAFRASWSRAIKRLQKIVGRAVPLAKHAGTTIHGVRHFNGKAWLEFTSIENVRKILRHVNILSTLVYTAADDEEIHNIAEDVSERAKNGDFLADFAQFTTIEGALKEYANAAFGTRSTWR
jgi:hypothetical protein